MTEEIVITDQEIEVVVFEPEVEIVHEGAPGAAGADGTAAVNVHIADSTDAHTSTAISHTPSGNIAATDVGGAINELDSDKVAKAGDTMVGDLFLSNSRLGVSASSFGTVEKLRVNEPTIVSNTTNVMLAASATTSTPLVIQGVSAQTGDLQQWQDSTGAAPTVITSSGALQWGTNAKLYGASTTGLVLEHPTAGMPARMSIFRNGMTTGMFLYSDGGSLLSRIGGIIAGTSHYGLSISHSGSAGAVLGGVAFPAPESGSTTNVNAQVVIIPSATTVVGEKIRGMAAQSANLTEWQNSGSTVIASVGADGFVAFGGNHTAQAPVDARRTGSGPAIYANQLGDDNGLEVHGSGTTTTRAVLKVNSNVAGAKGAIVQGYTGQTANLQEWQDSTGAAGSYIKANTHFSGYSDLPMTWFSSGGSSDFANWTTTGSNLWLILKGVAGSLLITPQGATGVPIRAQGYAAQTANLQNWEDSSANILANISANGTLTTTALKTTAQSHGAAGATETIDLANGDVHGITLDANCTLTFSGSTSGKACTISLIVTQDIVGGWGITWPASVDWPNATAPTLTGTAGSVDMFTFMTIDGGTTWYGVTAGLAFG